MDKSTYINRRKRLMESLDNRSLAILRGSTAVHIYSGNYRPFRQNSNFYYLTGLNEPNIMLFLLKNPSGVSEFLFLERPDEHVEQWERKILKAKDASLICGIERSYYIDEAFKVLERLVPSVNNIYIDESFDQFVYNKDLSRDIVQHVRKLYPTRRFLDISGNISPLRLIKDKQEINCIKKAVEITGIALDEARQFMHEGIAENEVLGKIIQVFLSCNTYASFSPIVGSGPESTILHYDKNSRKTKKNDVILIDIGTEYQFYSSDITRTFPSCGKFTDFQRDAYQTVLDAQEFAFSIAKPGISLLDFNKEVREYQKDLYVKRGFAKDKYEAEGIIVHNISHYLGLDPHDPGDFSIPMQPGMVITVEPGIYMKEKGFGIRIEDDIMITKSGNEILSAGIKKKLRDIEK